MPLATKTIRQTVTFKAGPNDVYEALMDSHRHAAFTGAGADIGRQVGDPFSAYDGSISGNNLELVPDRKIVQAWRCAATGWPEGHYSHLTIALEPVDGGTKLTLTHEGVPEPSYDECNGGWKGAYWEKLQRTFGW